MKSAKDAARDVVGVRVGLVGSTYYTRHIDVFLCACKPGGCRLAAATSAGARGHESEDQLTRLATPRVHQRGGDLRRRGASLPHLVRRGAQLQERDGTCVSKAAGNETTALPPWFAHES